MRRPFCFVGTATDLGLQPATRTDLPSTPALAQQQASVGTHPGWPGYRFARAPLPTELLPRLKPSLCQILWLQYGGASIAQVATWVLA